MEQTGTPPGHLGHPADPAGQGVEKRAAGTGKSERRASSPFAPGAGFVGRTPDSGAGGAKAVPRTTGDEGGDRLHRRCKDFGSWTPRGTLRPSVS